MKLGRQEDRGKNIVEMRVEKVVDIFSTMPAPSISPLPENPPPLRIPLGSGTVYVFVILYLAFFSLQSAEGCGTSVSGRTRRPSPPCLVIRKIEAAAIKDVSATAVNQLKENPGINRRLISPCGEVRANLPITQRRAR